MLVNRYLDQLARLLSLDLQNAARPEPKRFKCWHSLVTFYHFFVNTRGLETGMAYTGPPYVGHCVDTAALCRYLVPIIEVQNNEFMGNDILTVIKAVCQRPITPNS